MGAFNDLSKKRNVVVTTYKRDGWLYNRRQRRGSG